MAIGHSYVFTIFSFMQLCIFSTCILYCVVLFLLFVAPAVLYMYIFLSFLWATTDRRTLTLFSGRLVQVQYSYLEHLSVLQSYIRELVMGRC